LTSTLNFSFWTDDKEKESYCRRYKNKIYLGYEALCVAINQALDVNITFQFYIEKVFNIFIIKRMELIY